MCVYIYGGNRYKKLFLMGSVFVSWRRYTRRTGFQMQMCLNIFVLFILPELTSKHIDAHAEILLSFLCLLQKQREFSVT